jgi:hypothetical protein
MYFYCSKLNDYSALLFLRDFLVYFNKTLPFNFRCRAFGIFLAPVHKCSVSNANFVSVFPPRQFACRPFPNEPFFVFITALHLCNLLNVILESLTPVSSTAVGATDLTVTVYLRFL